MNKYLATTFLALCLVSFVVAGCETDLSGLTGGDGLAMRMDRLVDPDGGAFRLPGLWPHDRSVLYERQTGESIPPDQVDIAFGSEDIRVWPYTGRGFDAVPSDPINLVFVGKADPVAIRSALLALDGDRSAFGFPPAPPFDARWTDAQADVQTAYPDGDGWRGSVVQIALGDYPPVRFHLRLFRTGAAFGDGGEWTLGGAHFEVLIPGTADHQVLSWELAEQIVAADLVRSGLLDPASPLAPSGPLHAGSSFREIPDFLYNGLPPELIALIGGPAPPVSGGVPIASDGRATILHVAGAAEPAPGTSQVFTIQFDQAIPRPFCADGPQDWVHVRGPIRFTKHVRTEPNGSFGYRAHFSGRLNVVPVDITQSPPVPIGEPFVAVVSEEQGGDSRDRRESVHQLSHRVAAGEREFQSTRLRVATPGRDLYEIVTRCVPPQRVRAASRRRARRLV